jgi:7-cyano-7-deazaguanine synthase
LQPYDRLVHNGTIANDRDLGAKPGEVDSMALARHVDRRSLRVFVNSLAQVKGSYAIACVAENSGTVYLACNYKPIHFLTVGDSVYFSSMERHLSPLCSWGVRPVQLPPYSAVNLSSRQLLFIPRDRAAKDRVVVVASAGLDSTVAATKYVREGKDVCLLHFTYGCRAESREVDRVRRIADALACACRVLPLPYEDLKGNSPLLSKEARIAEGIEGSEFAHEWVPARNLVMLSHAVAFAEAHGYGVVALGNNLEESGAYPDNEEQFTHLLDKAVEYAVADGHQVSIEAPLGNLMKHEIANLGIALDAPLDLTWSCYKDGDFHCGECGPCFMRRTAFARIGLVDPVFST